LPDIWRLWSQKSGIPVAFKQTSWERSLEMVRSGEADLHAGIVDHHQRSGCGGIHLCGGPGILASQQPQQRGCHPPDPDLA
ncbi:hypothetical protein QQ73_09785, partial [Candidatus Endoriftia persephone str. Guaymas]|nr:hypothetical protein [Candidatus Endoriftia persephone str. Guaymas]